MGNLTLDYYNRNAERFLQDTAEAGMTEIQGRFLKYVAPGGRILDLGCGSGRDSKAFLQAGYQVHMVDGSEKLAAAAEILTGQPVVVTIFQEFRTEEKYDGIWACASLLHLPMDEIRDVISRLSANLKPEAVFYMSFKYGDFSGERNGRFFTDMTEDRFRKILESVPELELMEEFITSDVRPGRGEEKWLNVFCRRNRNLV